MVEYKQLPKSVDGKCLLCKRRLLQRKETVIFIYDKNMKHKKITEKLFICPSCRVKYANSDIFNHIRINNKGYQAIGFMPDSKSGSEAVMQKATSFPENFKKNRKSMRKREVKESFQGFDTYQGKTYYVPCRKMKDSYTDVILDSVVIRSGGGYYSYKNNNKYHLVDALMYSPFTQTYEIIHATYDKDEYVCFIDISIFRDFIKKYGNPGIKIFPPGPNGIYSDLKEESLLHVFGYNVNQKDNLSDGERCAILAEIIDLELMKPQTIVRFLSGCADRMRGKDNYKACAKYKHDIEYIKNYKVNPQRFLIVNTKNK